MKCIWAIEGSSGASSGGDGGASHGLVWTYVLLAPAAASKPTAGEYSSIDGTGTLPLRMGQLDVHPLAHPREGWEGHSCEHDHDPGHDLVSGVTEHRSSLSTI
ncbi:UNVERIFIED_CONTAM: hypothetical protein Sindi_2033200 [Sesamum indicum]